MCLPFVSVNRSEIFLTAILFSTTMTCYILSSNITPYDSFWTVHVAASLIHEKNLDLDEFASVIPEDDYRISRLNGHLYSYFPIGTPLLSVPLVWVAEKRLDSKLKRESSLYDSLQTDYTVVPDAERALGSLFSTLTVVVVFWIARHRLSLNRAFLVAALFAFGTSAWSQTSRGSWQHGPSMLMLSLVLLLLLAAEKRPGLAALAGVPMAIAYVVRPTNGISVLLLTVYVFLVYRKQFVPYLLFAAAVAIPFLFYNIRIYGGPFSQYYSPRRLESSPYFLEALLGNLISPARGLFVFSPFFLFLPIAFLCAKGKERNNRLEITLGAIIVLHWITISSFPHWYGGYSMGPRFMSDMLPFLTYLLLPLVANLNWKKASLAKRAISTSFLAVAGVSILIHGYCANSKAVFDWNSTPVSVDIQPDRVWDWRDPPFLRGTFLDGRSKNDHDHPI